MSPLPAAGSITVRRPHQSHASFIAIPLISYATDVPYIDSFFNQRHHAYIVVASSRFCPRHWQGKEHGTHGKLQGRRGFVIWGGSSPAGDLPRGRTGRGHQR